MERRRKSSRVLLCLWILSCPSLIWAANGKLSGTIKDARTGEPLIGANVMVEGIWRGNKIVPFDGRLGAVADLEGFYYILNIPTETYAVKASMVGYEAKTITNVRVELDRTVTLNFTLKEMAIDGQSVTITAQKEVVQLDVSSSQIVMSKEETANLPVNTIQELMNLTPGVSVSSYDNKVNIRGGGSDQVMAYLDGFSLKDNVFNVPFLSYNRTSIEEISIQTGGFLAEYGDLRSGIINVTTSEGGSRYNVLIDGRYRPAGYKYDGPKQYTEDKYYLMYGSDFSFDSAKLAQMFPLPQDKFDGWIVYAEKNLTDKDSTNDRSPNQNRELWRWQHRGREEGNRPDYVVDGTVSGPMPGGSLPLVGPLLKNTSFMLSNRTNYMAYEHPGLRNHFGEDNTTLKLTYRPASNMRLMVMGMLANESGTGVTASERGNDAYVMRSGGGGWYGNSNYPLGDIRTTNWGLNFVHTLSPKTFYEVRVSRMERFYDFRQGPDRDTTKIKTIDAEYYKITSDTLKAKGYWNPATGRYVAKDTTFYAGDQLWFPSSSYDEAPDGWMIPGRSVYDQTGKYNLNASSGESDNSYGWSMTARADLTSQVNKYHQIKTGIYFSPSLIRRDFYQIRTAVEDRAIRYTEKPQYGGLYLQDRLEIRGLTGNFGLRGELFDANANSYDQSDPFSNYWYMEDMWTNLDSMQASPSKKYFRISPRLGISHPMTASSKIYFNYGHAYNAPSNSYRYGFITHPRMDSPIEWRGNPDLKPQKTVQYELGYEQVLFDQFLVHTSVYYKDVTDELGSVYYQNIFSPNPTRRYYTWSNKTYEDIIGWELRLYKRLGRFVTGWIQTEFSGSKVGQIGYENLFVDGDPLNLSTYSKFSYPDEVLWDWIPSVLANVDIHTPSDWGPRVLGSQLFGGWRLNAILSWAEGARHTWNPTNSPFVRNNLQWTNSFSNDFYLSKELNFFGVSASVYSEVHNPFNRKLLNIGALDGLAENPGSEIYQYYASLKSGDRIGQYKQSHLVYPKEKPGVNYYYRVGGPVQVFFGMRLNMDFGK